MDEIKALIREEVTRQLDAREAEARKDLEEAKVLMSRIAPVSYPWLQERRVTDIEHDPKDAA